MGTIIVSMWEIAAKKALLVRFLSCLLGVLVMAVEASAEPVKGFPPLGRVVKTISTAEPIATLAWSPDGKYVSGIDWRAKDLYLWDLRSGRQVWTEKYYGAGDADSLEFSVDGQQIITVFMGSARKYPEHVLSLVSTATGKVIRHVSLPPPKRGANHAGDFSIDQNLAAVAIGQTGYLGIFDTSDWTLLKRIGPFVNEYGNNRGFRLVALSRKHDLVITGSEGFIHSWSLSKNKPITMFETYFMSHVTAIALDRSRGILLTGGDMNIRSKKPLFAPGEPMDFSNVEHDDWTNLLRAWDPFTGQQINMDRGPECSIKRIKTSSDGRLIAATCSDRGIDYVVVWRIETGELLGVHGDRIESVKGIAFSPDGGRIAYANHEGIQIIELAPRLLGE